MDSASRLSWLVSAMVVVPGFPAFADEPSTRQRPSDDLETIAPTPCCGAAIVPAGHFELEANYSGDGVRGALVHTSNLTLKYSLTERVQLQLGTANLFVSGGEFSSRAFDGVSPGVKFVLLDAGDVSPQLAISAHGALPTLSREDALQATVDAWLMVYVSKNLGPFHFDATASLTLADLAGSPIAQGGASLTATWNLDDRWGLSTGPYSSFGNEQRRGVDGGWFGAVNFAPRPQLALTAGVEAGFFPDTRSYSFFAGVAWVPTANAQVLLASAPGETPHRTASR